MLEKLHFEQIINAPAEKVWQTMLGSESYKQWTSVFDPRSTYEGSWEKGSEIKFIGSNGGGMYSEIAENIPGKFISIKHLGELKEGGIKSDVKEWENAHENYTFTDVDGNTKLSVDLDTVVEYADMFKDMWPKALLKLKEICER